MQLQAKLFTRLTQPAMQGLHKPLLLLCEYIQSYISSSVKMISWTELYKRVYGRSFSTNIDKVTHPLISQLVCLHCKQKHPLVFFEWNSGTCSCEIQSTRGVIWKYNKNTSHITLLLEHKSFYFQWRTIKTESYHAIVTFVRMCWWTVSNLDFYGLIYSWKW